MTDVFKSHSLRMEANGRGMGGLVLLTDGPRKIWADGAEFLDLARWILERAGEQPAEPADRTTDVSIELTSIAMGVAVDERHHEHEIHGPLHPESVERASLATVAAFRTIFGELSP